MKNFVILLLAVALLICGGVIALTVRERNEAQRESGEAKVKLAELQDKVVKQEAASVALRKERDFTQTELKLSQERLAAAAKAPMNAAGGSASGSPGPSGGGVGAPSSTRSMKALADMMKNPAMKEMVKQQQLAQLEMQYAGLISQFQLDDAEKANFKQLLAERLQLEGDVGLQMMDASLTAEQRKALMNQVAESRKASDAKIKTFLNSDEDYKTYQNWEDSKAERMQLSMGQSLFSASGEPLSVEQQQQLVSTMSSVRRQASTVPDLSKPENFDASSLTPAGIQRQLADYDRRAQQVLAEAARFLTPKQLNALKSLQQQWRAMQEAGMNMGSVMTSDKGR